MTDRINIANRIKSTGRRLALLLMSMIIFMPAAGSQAISPGDYDNLHTEFYDDCVSIEGQADAGISGDIKSVYMRGDSITVGAMDLHIEQAFDKKDIKATVTGSGGGIVTRAGGTQTSPNGDQLTGLNAINKDKKTVKNSDAVIVAYGTNNYPSEMASEIKKMVNKIRKINYSATIFWVNTYTNNSTLGETLNGVKAYTKESSKKKNETIENLSSKLNYHVVDITQVIKDGDITSDGIHPDDINKWSNYIVDFVANGGDAASEPVLPSDTKICCPSGDSAEGATDEDSITGSSDAEIAFKYFIKNPEPGLSKQGAAGIVGNLMRETGGDSFDFDPNSSGTYEGIAQWSSSRWAGLESWANKHDKNPRGLLTQLEYIWIEMNTDYYKEVVPKLKDATDPAQAARDFNDIFEVGADEDLRANNAEKAFNNFKDVVGPEETGVGAASSCCAGGLSVGSNSDLDRFLKVLAYQESGGDPTQPGSAGDARGKYQYIDDTWEASTRTYYPPAHKYKMAHKAPEAMQDAVAYLEYLYKFKQYNNDLFKLAVSHFYPAANDDPAKLDEVPEANQITPRQYANDIKEKINSPGAWDKIKLKYTNAPEFQKWLDKVGATPAELDDATEPVSECSEDSGATGEFQLPLDKKWYDENPTWFTKPHHDHPSADIPVPLGTPVYSMTAGKVASVDGGGCGVSVFITPEGYDNVEIGYCHGVTGSREVAAGTTVEPGKHLFNVDNTGDSEGDHLHVQIKVNGVLHCPQNLFKAIGDGKPVPKFKDLPASGCTN